MSVLTDLGYDASMKAISPTIQFTYIQNTNNNVQLSISQWYMDYPAPSNFLNVLLSCDTFHKGSDSSINISGNCNKDLDAKMKAGDDTVADRQDAANAEWAKIDKGFMEQAPLAPLFTPKSVNFTSALPRQLCLQQAEPLDRLPVLCEVTPAAAERTSAAVSLA